MQLPTSAPGGPGPGSGDIEELLVEALGVLEDGGSAALEQLLAARPEHAPRLRDPQAALELCRIAVGDAGEQPAAQYWLAKALVANGARAEALEVARAARGGIAAPVPEEQALVALRLDELIAELAAKP